MLAAKIAAFVLLHPPADQVAADVVPFPLRVERDIASQEFLREMLLGRGGMGATPAMPTSPSPRPAWSASGDQPVRQQEAIPAPEADANNDFLFDNALAMLEIPVHQSYLPGLGSVRGALNRCFL